MRQDYMEARLQRYFDEHYSEYDETAEWHGNPAPNKWRFNIPSKRLIVTLICDVRGNITEKRSLDLDGLY